jgi:hypothetical protein
MRSRYWRDIRQSSRSTIRKEIRVQTERALSIFRRVIGTVRLDDSAVADIERDQNATWQAVVVVALAGVANAVGVVLTGDIGYIGIVTGIGGGFLTWALYSGLAYILGAGILPGEATEAEATARGVFRTVGFAHAPNMLGIAIVIGTIGQIASFLGLLWMFVCAIFVLRVALRVTTARAFAIGLISWAITLVITSVAINLFDAVFI